MLQSSQMLALKASSLSIPASTSINTTLGRPSISHLPYTTCPPRPTSKIMITSQLSITKKNNDKFCFTDIFYRTRKCCFLPMELTCSIKVDKYDAIIKIVAVTRRVSKPHLKHTYVNSLALKIFCSMIVYSRQTGLVYCQIQ